jgi:hypothetical protein
MVIAWYHDAWRLSSILRSMRLDERNVVRYPRPPRVTLRCLN